MTTRETLTIRKAELFAEIKDNAKRRAKEFVENELARIGEDNAVVKLGQAIINCPVYLDPKYVGEELAAAGFELEKPEALDKWTFVIEW